MKTTRLVIAAAAGLLALAACHKAPEAAATDNTDNSAVVANDADALDANAAATTNDATAVNADEAAPAANSADAAATNAQ
jgi:hypothetical protein